ncbi:NAD(P)H-dependent oxidoreductase [Exilibacterium tricleocarpae]|uniref:NAD(P)H-dependent oxidoreductase n=1 Tax=Exilibacterium tricleocarpae TaxID=2591008 RepID=A0A545SRT2_9GAMM|nr:NAD(P)H-dependent oxidoreductase [Exilibacterium tricleocarpae]TQV67667.1 NAD(P)H-dependent oxidoreductase [Exilibacterium tricleocarpae]
MMNVCVISGSHRQSSNTLKCANYVLSRLESRGHTCQLIDLFAQPVPIWSEDFWSNDSSEKNSWHTNSEILKASDAYVVMTPEYCGMATPSIKNFLLKCNGVETGNKPVLLIGISAGLGGISPILELKLNGFKNNFMCVIPYSVIIRNADTMLNGEKPDSDEEMKLRESIQYALDHLLIYAESLSHVRLCGLTDFDLYPYGQV